MPDDIIATDLEAYIPRIEKNILLNPTAKIRAMPLDWFACARGQLPMEGADVILAADVVWADHLIDPLLLTIRGILSSNSAGKARDIDSCACSCTVGNPRRGVASVTRTWDSKLKQ